MLTAYQQKVLQIELAKSDYNNMTADQAWAWLMLPTTTTTSMATHAKLTPLFVASILGPVKAEVIAQRVKAALPTIADSIMTAGADLSDPVTVSFVGALVGDPITQQDINTILAYGTQVVSNVTPRRFESRFDPINWPHVAVDGSIGGQSDPALSGFPNDLVRADFDLSWRI